MKLFNVEFTPLFPVPCCLVILAKDEEEARKIASKTISHTPEFEIEEVDMSNSGVVKFESGDY